MDEPRLVKKDGERMAPADAPISRSEFMEAMKMLTSALTTVQAQQTDKTDTLAELVKQSRAEFERNDNNYLAKFPNVSAFNPRGENASVGGVARNPIKGEVSWVGTPCVWHEMTYDEIQLLNQLEPGKYHNGEWVVRDLEPDIKGSRKLRVDFPNLDPDKRAELPSGYWDSNARDEQGQPLVGLDLNNPLRKGRQVTGMELMLREMVEEAQARLAVSA